MTRAEYLRECLNVGLHRCIVINDVCKYAHREDHETYCQVIEDVPRCIDLTECPRKKGER